MRAYHFLAVIALTACHADTGARESASHASAAPSPVGLSLLFVNGELDVPAIDLPFDAPRYFQELDIIATVDTATDEGILPVTHEGDLASLDWQGAHMVEEDWRQDLDGTWIRQRFYRGAAWMEMASVVHAFPVDDAGEPVGAPILARMGRDDHWSESDDGFVRRFFARQYVTGCQAEGDCSNATSFRAQALVQFRVALHASQRARPIPAEATALSIVWTAQPARQRVVPLTRSSGPYGPGLELQLSEVSEPANGAFYAPGEHVTFQVTMRDGEGNRLHPQGSLPTYGQFVRGEVESGLRYYDGFRLQPTLFYALKHREGLMAVGLVGPTDAIRVPRSTVDAAELLLPQATTASVSEDGYTGLAAMIPPGLVVFGGAVEPALWEMPVSDLVTFTIPEDALPGTYVASLKARRDHGGEALNRGATTDIQVGTPDTSVYVPRTGACGSCHSNGAELALVGHGFADRRVCVTCHAPLSFEPDNGLDTRMHWIHDRSRRFSGDMQDCAQCHLEPPSGPASGLR
jgi:hypothetical protein